MEVLGRVLVDLRESSEAAGKLHQFEVLKVYLTGEESRPYRELAAQLEMSEAAFKVAVHRLRQEFGRQLRDEIGQTVSDRKEIDDEIRYLLSVIGRRRQMNVD